MILDEPTSALDVSVQAQVLELLKKLKRSREMAYMFISHDLTVVHYISDVVAVMYLGKVVEYGDENEIFENPLHPYTKALLSAAPLPDPHERTKKKRIILKGTVPSPINPPAGCRFHPRCFEKKGAICEKEIPEMKKVGKDHWVACFNY
jgi:oligopeptide/dipeptide ABC transporter ATP-binding protein